jgi:vitamin B12 transporter
MRCRSLTLLLIAASPVVTGLARAEDLPQPQPSPQEVPIGETIVVTPERRETTLARSADNVDVVDPLEQRLRGYPLSPWQWLVGLPGVDAAPGSGGIDGGVPRLKVRGANSYDTQVQVDGIPIEDPTATQGQPDLAALYPAGLESVEVVRGAQSGLYGSRAVGGVVDYTTLRPTSETHGDARAEYGAYNTTSVSADVTGAISPTVGITVAATGFVSDGFSASTNLDQHGNPAGHEADSVARSGATSRIEWRPQRSSLYWLSVNTVALRQEFDDFGNPDDPLSHDLIRSYRVAGGTDQRISERATVGAEAAYTDFDKFYTSPSFTATYYGQTTYAAAHGRYALMPHLDLAAGADGRRQDLSISSGGYQKAHDWLGGVWGQIGSTGEMHEIALTGRGDAHSRAGDAATWRAAGALFLLEGSVKPHASAGTGFRAPSLYELFDPFAGNTELRPQRSFSWDAGISYLPQNPAFADCAVLDVTYFHTHYSSLIDYVDPDGFLGPIPGRYQNIDAYTVHGVESGVRLQAPEIPLFVRLAYTWQRALEIPTQAANSYSTNLPEHNFALLVGAHAKIDQEGRREAWLAMSFRRVGSTDSGFGGGTYLPWYSLLGASAGLQFSEGLEVYMRAENLLDNRVETYPGVTSTGQAFYFGGGAHF